MFNSLSSAQAKIGDTLLYRNGDEYKVIGKDKAFYKVKQCKGLKTNIVYINKHCHSIKSIKRKR
jgi:hypothetical protein